ncbi:PLP-dependent transferase [Alloscardovia macacae]|uniref:PLP-dependent transferase n=1 Tax=Alloscardovia macacae TaxID=1160091 RepID=UPI0015D7EE82|nr:PLP-dependent transferase [Alloscardovia macacae]
MLCVVEDGGSFPRHKHVERFTQFAEPEFTLYNETLDHVPQEAYLALLGLETISERLSKQGSTAERIADFLRSSEFVSKVNYSSTTSLAAEYFPHGIGSIFSFELIEDESRVNRLINSCQIFSYVQNVGDVRSLIINPARTTHREVPFEFWEKDGLIPQLIRLSIGLEDADDLIVDLDQAIRTAFES